MPKQKKKTVPQTTQETLLVEEEPIDYDATSASHSDPGELTLHEDKGMANLLTILQELREFRIENAETLRGKREDLKVTNSRIDEAERRIDETEERVLGLEEATRELLKLQTQLQDKLTDQEGRARRENIRIHGVTEGSESNSTSVMTFVENLLKENLELPRTDDLKIERAHRALGPKPPPDAPLRSIVVKFSSSKTKEEILKQVWRKKGLSYQGKKVFVDHDYAPEILRKRREYAEAKKVL